MVKPTRIHYLFAEDWPVRIWMWSTPLVAVVAGVIATWPLISSPGRWTDSLMFVFSLFLFLALGWFGGILIGWPIMGPLYYGRSLKNGEPFKTGDSVHILVGSHCDRIVRVREAIDVQAYAGGHRVFVDLGETAKENQEDVFKSYQVLRVSQAEPRPVGEAIDQNGSSDQANMIGQTKFHGNKTRHVTANSVRRSSSWSGKTEKSKTSDATATTIRR